MLGPLAPGATPEFVPGVAPRAGAETAVSQDLHVLVFSKTAGFRHASIERGVRAMQTLGHEHGFEVEATEDAAAFTDKNLEQYDAVIFLSTTGDILDEPQERAFERYIQAGGGYVGVHAAADTEYDWPWYGTLVGGYFKSHPRVQQATTVVADRLHPSTAHLPARWERTDEWYDYRDNPRGSVHVLATIDERTYEGGKMGHDHPIAWCHEFDGGRAWYTGGGHTKASFAEPEFMAHILGGIQWAAGQVDADVSATLDRAFDKVVLDRNVSDPMELAIAPDGRVIFVERGGAVKIFSPQTKMTGIAGYINVFTSLEDGLLGVTLDPGFARNGWFYLYYSPPGEAPINRLSRFTMVGEAFAPESERIMLEVETQRLECCHSGGSITFGPDGLLYLSTGDNTNPFASDGYAPIDERENRSPWDAQRGSANTHDLRGKVLRIRPLADGAYEVPDGNLFAKDGSQGRPEIYVMGCRNPFRISVDAETGALYWGDVGPDASSPHETRGPAGHDEFNRAASAGFYGWPYFIGDNLPYVDFDFTNRTSGEAFDPAAPINQSANNTGAGELPPARPAWISYPYAASEKFPELGSGGRCAMAGPTYHFDTAVDGKNKLPAYFDDTVFIYEWTRNWIMEVKVDQQGEILKINPFAPHLSFIRPMDMELGPDGRLYMIEWGTGFGGGNRDAQVVRIDYYASGERPPVAGVAALMTNAPAGMPVRLYAEGSLNPDTGNREGLTYAWDCDGDGVIDSREYSPVFEYATPGSYDAQLTVTAPNGMTASASIPITIGNMAPDVEFEWPPTGAVLAFGKWTEFRVNVEDYEDGEIDAKEVLVQPLLGHDTHAHPLHQQRGLAGFVQSIRDGGHAADADLFTVIAATYTDHGAPNVRKLTRRAEIILQPERKQAEHYTAQLGTQIEKVSDPLGGVASVAYIDNGDFTSYSPVNLHKIDALNFRVASNTQGGVIEVRLDAVGGPLVTEVTVPNTGGWQEWIDVKVDIEDPGGTHELYLVFKGGEGALFNVNWIDFIGKGVAVDPPEGHGAR